MGFSTSIIPLESNTGYIHSNSFSYPTFSEWFDKVKVVFSGEENFSELKSDRVEAIHDLYGSFMSITFSEKGFSFGTKPSVLVRTDNGSTTTHFSSVLPDIEEGETLVELTQRWVESLHAQIAQIIRDNKIRARWFTFAYTSTTNQGLPPDLFPPTEVYVLEKDEAGFIEVNDDGSVERLDIVL